MNRAFFLFVFLSTSVLNLATGQSVTLTDLPAGNLQLSAFDIGLAKHLPALSINGFDCSANGKNCDHGLGFKQIIENALNSSATDETKRLFEAVRQLSSSPILQPQNRGDIKQNNSVAESIGFVALATLLLEENGFNPTDYNLPTHEESVLQLSDLLSNTSALGIDESFSDDAVKWTGPLGSLARTIDFYLSLEQAYLHFNKPESSLFSCDLKSELLDFFQNQIQKVDALGNTSVMDLNFIKVLGFDVASVISDISYDEVQAGNWPMKVHVAVGYAAIVQQFPKPENCNLFEPVEDYGRWLGRALRSAGGPDHENRSHHWAYQTNNGQPFWAEGPFYFNYGLATVVPFLHAARQQDLLNENDDFNLSDPFKAGWFLNPLHAFADLVTPEGATPPLEDGNKIPMEAAHLLQWDASYGDASLGSKFAWIAASQSTLPSSDLWLHALSIPKATTMTPPAAEILPSTYPEHTQQIILRRDGRTGSCESLQANREQPCHYVLLNGESIASIRPGEGHEQSDQLQLLYYVDDTSYLMDGGYDSAPGIQNSSWNEYRHHNVMTTDRVGLEGGHGGLPGPVAGLSCTRKVSTAIGDIILPAACMYADHNPVEVWRHTQHGFVDVIEASISIYPDSPESGDEGLYKRTIFFIDDVKSPYLIDVNAASVKDASISNEVAFQMQYHGNASEIAAQSEENAALWRAVWAAPDSLGQPPRAGSNDLLIHSFAVEADYIATIQPEIFREVSVNGLGAGEGLSVNRLALSNTLSGTVAAPSHTTVAFIQPRPGDPSQYTTAPVTLTNLTEVLPRPWQVFKWQVSPESIDILMSRASSTDVGQVISTFVELPEDIKWFAAANFSTPGISFDSTSKSLTLSSGTEAAFIRLTSSTNVGIHSTEETAQKDESVLMQNSPNPFRKHTNIRYTLPTRRHIKLDIFDSLGRLVTTLHDGIQEQGTHVISWQPKNMTDGVYFCRLELGGQAITKQMVFLSH